MKVNLWLIYLNLDHFNTGVGKRNETEKTENFQKRNETERKNLQNQESKRNETESHRKRNET
jgi:hypothetical protein